MLGTSVSIAILIVCIVLMLRLMVGARRRHAIDAWARRVAVNLRAAWYRIYHWRTASKVAKQATEDAIRRARDDGGTWEGNVYKPKSFRKPPRDKMH